MDMEQNVNQDSRYLLDIRGLKTTFYTSDGVVPAVDGILDKNLGDSQSLVSRCG